MLIFISGKQFFTIFLKDLSSFSAIEWIHELLGLQVLQLSHMSWISSRTSYTLVNFSSLIFLRIVDKSIGCLIIDGQSVSPIPFQSTGSRKSKDSFDSYRQLIIILSFFIQSFPILVVEVSLRDDRIFIKIKLYLIIISQAQKMAKSSSKKITITVFLLIFSFLITYVHGDSKFLSDRYSRLKQTCTNRCIQKGYYQDLCTKLCMSRNCYHSIYNKQTVGKELYLQLGRVDQYQKQFRRCWMTENQQKNERAEI